MSGVSLLAGSDGQQAHQNYAGSVTSHTTIGQQPQPEGVLPAVAPLPAGVGPQLGFVPAGAASSAFPAVAAAARAAGIGMGCSSGSVMSRAPQKYLIQNQSGMKVYYWTDGNRVSGAPAVVCLGTILSLVGDGPTLFNTVVSTVPCHVPQTGRQVVPSLPACLLTAPASWPPLEAGGRASIPGVLP